MIKNGAISKAIGAVLTVLLLAGSFAVAHGDEEGGRLVEAKCTPCHGLNIVCALLGKRDQDGWDWIVSDMQRNGAKIKVADKRRIVDYLAGLHAGSPPVCPEPEKPKAAAPAKMDGEAMVMHYCVDCHDTRRICKNLRVKGKGGWDKTVTMMMLKGAAIDTSQKNVIVDYLFKLPAGSKPVCP